MVKPFNLTSTGKALNVEFVPGAWEDFEYWSKTDKRTYKKIIRLIKECCRTPFEGTGKPERLKHFGENVWSRRIDARHRLVYAADQTRLTILQCRFHYGE